MMLNVGHGAGSKPIVYVLVILPILLIGGIGVAVGLTGAYAHFSGIPRSAIPNLNGMLISLPAFLLWIPVSLLLGNGVLYSIPPLRRIAERHVAAAGRPGFGESQIQLIKAFVVLALVCVPLIVLGFAL